MENAPEPIVSVIIPVYNIASLLPRCLESLTEQTLWQIEILCVDDGSEDESAQVIRSFQERDIRVRLLQQAHQGVSAARNLGIACAAGEYVLFADGDDWLEANMLERMVAEAERTSCDMVVCSAKIHFEQRDLRGLRRRRSLQAALTVEDGIWNAGTRGDVWNILGQAGNWPFVWNKLIRRQLIEKSDLRFSVKLPLGEDGVFIHLLFQHAGRVAFLTEPLYNYRYQRKASATVRLFQNESVRFGQHIKVVAEMLWEFQQRGLMREQGGELLKWLLSFLYADFINLPAADREKNTQALGNVFAQYDLCAFRDELDAVGKKRLNHLLKAEPCTEAQRIWDILHLKIEDRVMRTFCRKAQ